jgi:hypothetical protein
MSHSSVNYRYQDDFNYNYYRDDFYDDITNVHNGSFNLEIGGINGHRGFTVHGIGDIGSSGGGYGVFLGRTTVNVDNKIFRFKGGVDLGFWYDAFSIVSLTAIHSAQIDRYTFGGPNLNFLIGYEPVFLSLAFKTYFGFYESNYSYPYYYGGYINNDYFVGFSAVYKWSVGVTATF